MQFALSVLFGVLIGFALGLTGGGGSIFAVPLLVYGLALEPRQAVGVSLAAVGATSLLGALERLRAREVEMGTGLLFALGGMLGAPVGTWIGGHVPKALLLVLFAGLMLVIAGRMWLQQAPAVSEPMAEPSNGASRSACRRDDEGRLCWTWRCAGSLAVVGLLTGILSGLFGVGGGFVIVPALVLFSGMAIHRAVATSLLVITLITAAGVASYLWDGRELPLDVTALFVIGGVLGMGPGTLLSRRLSGPRLQKVFAIAIVGVAAFIIMKTML
jgi:uncharacterized membrane protein YfcA